MATPLDGKLSQLRDQKRFHTIAIQGMSFHTIVIAINSLMHFGQAVFQQFQKCQKRILIGGFLVLSLQCAYSDMLVIWTWIGVGR